VGGDASDPHGHEHEHGREREHGEARP
jgi:hypothetical protein